MFTTACSRGTQIARAHPLPHLPSLSQGEMPSTDTSTTVQSILIPTGRALDLNLLTVFDISDDSSSGDRPKTPPPPPPTQYPRLTETCGDCGPIDCIYRYRLCDSGTYDDEEGTPTRQEADSSRPSSPAPRSRELWTPNPFPNRDGSANALLNAPPLSSRYEDELPEPGVVCNDLDGAQSRQIEAASRARYNRPVARPIVGASRRDYGYDRLSPAEVVRRAASQLLDTYTCGPAPETTDEVVQRQSLREHFLTPQVTTPSEYREWLRQQQRLCRPCGHSEVETTVAYEVQFQNWVELSRRLHSCDALKASFSEIDIRLERRFRFDFAKSQAKPRTAGQRPSRYEAPMPPAPTVNSHTCSHDSAATATGQSLSSATDLSSSHPNSGKRAAHGDPVVRPTGGQSPGDPDH
ncbi:hypothetical protein DVH05_024930 [Phytophthora capsici]|nr:hypothetical protein DVH05_024930 [Phytophthora capsici]